MGEWHHPAHYTETAKRFNEAARASSIAVFMDLCFPRLRETARTHGYALAIHGTLRRDIDLVAIPWTDKATAVDDLVAALAGTMRDCTGWGFPKTKESWTDKPHGRIALNFVASFDIEVDLSIMPRVPTEAPDE